MRQDFIGNILAAMIVLSMVFGGLIVLGLTLDGNSRYSEDRDRCLKRATTGYEIKQCH